MRFRRGRLTESKSRSRDARDCRSDGKARVARVLLHWGIRRVRPDEAARQVSAPAWAERVDEGVVALAARPTPQGRSTGSSLASAARLSVAATPCRSWWRTSVAGR